MILDLGRLSDELLASLGVTFEQHPDRAPTPVEGAAQRVDRALDELASNAVAIRVAVIHGITTIGGAIREGITLRRFIDEAIAAGCTLYNDDGWEVRITPNGDGQVAEVDLYRKTRALSERFA